MYSLYSDIACINSLPNNKTSDQHNLKDFEDCKIIVT